MPMYAGIDGTVVEVPNWYTGIDGTMHQITKFPVGIDGTVYTINLIAGTKVNFTFQNEATPNPNTGNDTFQIFSGMTNYLSQVIVNGNTYSLYYNQPKAGKSYLSVSVEENDQMTIVLHSSATVGDPQYGTTFIVNGEQLTYGAIPKTTTDFTYVYSIQGSLNITLRCYGEPFPATADGPYTTGDQYVTIDGPITQISGPNMEA